MSSPSSMLPQNVPENCLRFFVGSDRLPGGAKSIGAADASCFGVCVRAGRAAEEMAVVVMAEAATVAVAEGEVDPSSSM